MNTTLTIKTNTRLIGEAKKLAKDMGISLTSVVNAYLRQFIKERKFSVSAEPMPTKEKMALWEQISKQMDAGDFSGPFSDTESLYKHLKI
jgi:antitoxin component of RelBE/YafQ-DinJ toxin-antitoxin module